MAEFWPEEQEDIDSLSLAVNLIVSSSINQDTRAEEKTVVDVEANQETRAESEDGQQFMKGACVAFIDRYEKPKAILRDMSSLPFSFSHHVIDLSQEVLNEARADITLDHQALRQQMQIYVIKQLIAPYLADEEIPFPEPKCKALIVDGDASYS